MNTLKLTTLNEDIIQLLIESECPTGNHFELYYNNIDIYSSIDWIILIVLNKENELEIAGNYIKLFLNGELYTKELQNYYFYELCKN